MKIPNSGLQRSLRMNQDQKLEKYIQQVHPTLIHTDATQNPDGVRKMLIDLPALLEQFHDSKIHTAFRGITQPISMEDFVDFLESVDDNDTKGRYVEYGV